MDARRAVALRAGVCLAQPLNGLHCACTHTRLLSTPSYLPLPTRGKSDERWLAEEQRSGSGGQGEPLSVGRWLEVAVRGDQSVGLAFGPDLASTSASSFLQSSRSRSGSKTC